MLVKRLMMVLLVAAALVAAAVPVRAQGVYMPYSFEQNCDKQTGKCSIDKEMLLAVARANTMMDQSLRQFSALMQEQQEALSRLSIELEKAQSAKKCAALEVLPPTRKGPVYRGM